MLNPKKIWQEILNSASLKTLKFLDALLPTLVNATPQALHELAAAYLCSYHQFLLQDENAISEASELETAMRKPDFISHIARLMLLPENMTFLKEAIATRTEIESTITRITRLLGAVRPTLTNATPDEEQDLAEFRELEAEFNEIAMVYLPSHEDAPQRSCESKLGM